MLRGAVNRNSISTVGNDYRKVSFDVQSSPDSSSTSYTSDAENPRLPTCKITTDTLFSCFSENRIYKVELVDLTLSFLDEESRYHSCCVEAAGVAKSRTKTLFFDPEEGFQYNDFRVCRGKHACCEFVRELENQIQTGELFSPKRAWTRNDDMFCILVIFERLVSLATVAVCFSAKDMLGELTYMFYALEILFLICCICCGPLMWIYYNNRAVKYVLGWFLMLLVKFTIAISLAETKHLFGNSGRCQPYVYEVLISLAVFTFGIIGHCVQISIKAFARWKYSDLQANFGQKLIEKHKRMTEMRRA